MKLFGRIKISVLFVALLWLSACNNAKRLPEGKYLLNKNVIETDNSEVDKSDLTSLIKQKPNKKSVGLFRIKLSAYMLGQRIDNDSSKIKRWLMTSVGEEPVILDSSMAINTARQMEYLLKNKGYFEAGVEKKIDYEDNRKAVVKYAVTAKKPYHIRKVHYLYEDSTIANDVNATRQNSLIQPGETFDTDVFDDERERITEYLRNHGFYYFNKNYIEFQVDSNMKGRELDVYLQVNYRVYKAQMYQDSLVALPHRKFKVRNVYIYSDYDALKKDDIQYDTLKYEKSGAVYNFLYDKTLAYNPEILSQYVFIKPGKYYNMQDQKMTNRRLADLQQFKYINIEFLDVYGEMKPWFRDTMPKVLDCYIRLTRDAKQAFTFEWLGKNTSRDLGTEVSLVYSNKNLFRGSEVLNLSTNLSLETQQIIGDKNEQNITRYLPFNTLEYGVNAALDLPKFLLPIDQTRFPAYFKPRTTFSSGYNYRERPDYSRHLINLSFGFRFDETPTKQHQILLADINSIKLNPDSTFINKLNEIDNKKFLSAYEDHLIVGGKYTYILNTQGARKKEPDYWYLRTTFETAGFLLNSAAKLFQAPENEDGYRELFKIRYAQYLRSEVDYRYFYRFNAQNRLATRIAVGVGVPYGNLNVLPFERSFFVGGANGIRAWQLRSLGPGGFSGEISDFDKIGDISLETSVEYRFPLYALVEGAFFLDAGNVWLKDKNDKFPLGHFTLDRFYNQIAIGSGLGLRLDFSFFVIRLDAGIKIVDPSRLRGDRWVLDEYKIKNTNINFGIGYPF
ncbi:MAG: BamA/TamA family outer membrane protein [Bacteroidota bacterium]